MEKFAVNCGLIAGAVIGAAVVGTAGSIVEGAIEKSFNPAKVNIATGIRIGACIGGLAGFAVGGYVGKIITVEAVSKLKDLKYIKGKSN